MNYISMWDIKNNLKQGGSVEIPGHINQIMMKSNLLILDLKQEEASVLTVFTMAEDNLVHCYNFEYFFDSYGATAKPKLIGNDLFTMAFGEAHVYSIDQQETRLKESFVCSEVAWHSRDWMVYFQDKNRKRVFCRNLQTRNNFIVDVPPSQLPFGARNYEKDEMNRFHNVVCLHSGTLVFSLSNFLMGTYTPGIGFKFCKSGENVSFLEAFKDFAFQVDEAILTIHQKGVILAVLNFDSDDHEKGLSRLSRKITELQVMGTILITKVNSTFLTKSAECHKCSQSFISDLDNFFEAGSRTKLKTKTGNVCKMESEKSNIQFEIDWCNK